MSLQEACEKFFNQKTLNSFVGKQPFFVTTSESKLNAEEISQDHAFQYASILRTTEVLLWKEDVQKYVFSSGETENDGLICEFKDGLIYKNNPCGHLQIKQYKLCYAVTNFFVLTHWGTKLKNVKFLPFTLY